MEHVRSWSVWGFVIVDAATATPGFFGKAWATYAEGVELKSLKTGFFIGAGVFDNDNVSRVCDTVNIFASFTGL